ncbi:class I adenylate-forming enzyme family protein [Bradyrhizobium sp. 182]|uniref:AMP-binding protein n=1 Tax=Bradyrhizobium sp. 182 TaxID=2782651 RepID=UPI001FFB248D
MLQTAKGILRLGEVRAARLTPKLDRDRPVALSIRDPASLLKMLVACDGYVPEMLLISASLAPNIVQSLAARTACGTIVSDRGDISSALSLEAALFSSPDECTGPSYETAWIMTTSGTTGQPKMVSHCLAGLARTVRPWLGQGSPPVWGLTYEATRFAGMQVLLQAVLSGNLLVACDPEMEVAAKVPHWIKYGVTHLSATPTLWRQILMHPSSVRLMLRQVTLGGEISDQLLLDRLAARFPEARISHLYASTETGVGFSVKDGREGFPRRFLEEELNGVRLKLADGRLWVRTPGPKTIMIGSEERIRRDVEGYVDTHDRVELRGDRVLFVGRDTGAVNIGGSKVFPEAVERVINQMADVALVRVIPRRNPLSGAVLIAHIVLMEPVSNPDAFKLRVIKHCRARLPREAVPALVQLDSSLTVNAAGKLARSG